MMMKAFVSTVIAVLFLSQLLPSTATGVHAQSTCAIESTVTLATLYPLHSNISLLNLASSTLQTDPIAISIGFCSLIQPTIAGLDSTVGSCGADGYVTVTNLTSGQCLASYQHITSSIAYTTTRTAVSSVVATTNGLDVFANTKMNVTVACSTALLNTQAVLAENITFDQSTATWLVHFSSGAACNASSFFCTADADCSDGKSCVNNVCFNVNCTQVHAIAAPVVYENSGIMTLVSVTDCSGTPLPNLTATDFDVTLNGQSIRRSSQFSGEADMYVSSSLSSQPSLTVLLIDQSASITSTAASLAAVKAAATRFVQLVQGQSQFHYIAIVAFDGSAKPVIVVGHTTDTAKLEAGIQNDLPPAALTDAGSTNLYGAVKEAAALANAMRFSFGAKNASVSSTLIVFTDGYDTSARESRSAAVTAVQRQVETVRVVGVGVASSSDAIFLQSISTSGIFYFSSDLSTIGAAFEQIAQRLATSSSSVYAVGICSPIRSKNVTAVFLLNSTAYTTTMTVSTNFDASTHVGGTCSNETLAAELTTISRNSSTSNKTETLAIGAPLSVSVAPQAALFFSFTCDAASSPALMTVAPTTVVAYLLNSTATCGRVSPYCWDVTFTGQGTVECVTGRTYTGMLLPPHTSTEATTVTASAVSLAGLTPSPALVTIANANDSVTTTAAAPSGATTLFDQFNASSYTTEGSAHVDTPAAWLLFAFLLLGSIVVVTYNIYFWSERVKQEELAEAQSRQRSQKVNANRAWGGGRSAAGDTNNSSSPREQLVILAAAHPYNVHSPVRGPSNSGNWHEMQQHEGSSTPYSSYDGGRGSGNGGAYPHGGLSSRSAALTPMGHSRANKGFVPLDSRNLH